VKALLKQSAARENIGGRRNMQKYVCQVCGYVYDPEQGDPDGDIPAGTSFEDLPDEWTCPVCGAGKSEFEEED